MQPVQIVLRDIPSSEALQDHIRKKAQKLTQFYDQINTCRVVIDVPQKHKRQGRLFSVRIDITVPGRELVVNRKLDEDVYIAIREAFHALLRQLDCYARKRRGDVKRHEHSYRGQVQRLFPDEGYGFILGADGTEFYFDIASVIQPQHLAIGDTVLFLSKPENDGLQAHHITIEKKEESVGATGGRPF